MKDLILNLYNEERFKNRINNINVSGFLRANPILAYDDLQNSTEFSWLFSNDFRPDLRKIVILGNSFKPISWNADGVFDADDLYSPLNKASIATVRGIPIVLATSGDISSFNNLGQKSRNLNTFYKRACVINVDIPDETEDYLIFVFLEVWFRKIKFNNKSALDNRRILGMNLIEKDGAYYNFFYPFGAYCFPRGIGSEPPEFFSYLPLKHYTSFKDDDIIIQPQWRIRTVIINKIFNGNSVEPIEYRGQLPPYWGFERFNYELTKYKDGGNYVYFGVLPKGIAEELQKYPYNEYALGYLYNDNVENKFYKVLSAYNDFGCWSCNYASVLGNICESSSLYDPNIYAIPIAKISYKGINNGYIYSEDITDLRNLVDVSDIEAYFKSNIAQLLSGRYDRTGSVYSMRIDEETKQLMSPSYTSYCTADNLTDLYIDGSGELVRTATSDFLDHWTDVSDNKNAVMLSNKTHLSGCPRLPWARAYRVRVSLVDNEIISINGISIYDTVYGIGDVNFIYMGNDKKALGVQVLVKIIRGDYKHYKPEPFYQIRILSCYKRRGGETEFVKDEFDGIIHPSTFYIDDAEGGVYKAGARYKNYYETVGMHDICSTGSPSWKLYQRRLMDRADGVFCHLWIELKDTDSVGAVEEVELFFVLFEYPQTPYMLKEPIKRILDADLPINGGTRSLYDTVENFENHKGAVKLPEPVVKLHDTIKQEPYPLFVNSYEPNKVGYYFVVDNDGYAGPDKVIELYRINNDCSVSFVRSIVLTNVKKEISFFSSRCFVLPNASNFNTMYYMALGWYGNAIVLICVIISGNGQDIDDAVNVSCYFSAEQDMILLSGYGGLVYGSQNVPVFIPLPLLAKVDGEELVPGDRVHGYVSSFDIFPFFGDDGALTRFDVVFSYNWVPVLNSKVALNGPVFGFIKDVITYSGGAYIYNGFGDPSTNVDKYDYFPRDCYYVDTGQVKRRGGACWDRFAFFMGKKDGGVYNGYLFAPWSVDGGGSVQYGFSYSYESQQLSWRYVRPNYYRAEGSVEDYEKTETDLSDCIDYNYLFSNNTDEIRLYRVPVVLWGYLNNTAENPVFPSGNYDDKAYYSELLFGSGVLKPAISIVHKIRYIGSKMVEERGAQVDSDNIADFTENFPSAFFLVSCDNETRIVYIRKAFCDTDGKKFIDPYATKAPSPNSIEDGVYYYCYVLNNYILKVNNGQTIPTYAALFSKETVYEGTAIATAMVGSGGAPTLITDGEDNKYACLVQNNQSSYIPDSLGGCVDFEGTNRFNPIIRYPCEGIKKNIQPLLYLYDQSVNTYKIYEFGWVYNRHQDEYIGNFIPSQDIDFCVSKNKPVYIGIPYYLMTASKFYICYDEVDRTFNMDNRNELVHPSDLRTTNIYRYADEISHLELFLDNDAETDINKIFPTKYVQGTYSGFFTLSYLVDGQWYNCPTRLYLKGDRYYIDKKNCVPIQFRLNGTFTPKKDGTELCNILNETYRCNESFTGLADVSGSESYPYYSTAYFWLKLTANTDEDLHLRLKIDTINRFFGFNIIFTPFVSCYNTGDLTSWDSVLPNNIAYPYGVGRQFVDFTPIQYNGVDGANRFFTIFRQDNSLFHSAEFDTKDYILTPLGYGYVSPLEVKHKDNAVITSDWAITQLQCFIPPGETSIYDMFEQQHFGGINRSFYIEFGFGSNDIIIRNSLCHPFLDYQRNGLSFLFPLVKDYVSGSCFDYALYNIKYLPLAHHADLTKEIMLNFQANPLYLEPVVEPIFYLTSMGMGKVYTIGGYAMPAETVALFYSFFPNFYWKEINYEFLRANFLDGGAITEFNGISPKHEYIKLIPATDVTIYDGNRAQIGTYFPQHMPAGSFRNTWAFTHSNFPTDKTYFMLYWWENDWYENNLNKIADTGFDKLIFDYDTNHKVKVVNCRYIYGVKIYTPPYTYENIEGAFKRLYNALYEEEKYLTQYCSRRHSQCSSYLFGLMCLVRFRTYSDNFKNSQDNRVYMLVTSQHVEFDASMMYNRLSYKEILTAIYDGLSISESKRSLAVLYRPYLQPILKETTQWKL